MKKLLTALIIIILFTIPVRAVAADGFTEEINNLTQQYTENTDWLNFSLSDIFDYLKKVLKEKAVAPIKTGLKLLIIIFLYSVVQVLTERGHGAASVYQSRCTVMVFINLMNPLNNIIGVISENLYSVKNFMISFLPIYAGISLSSGEVFSSQIYTGFLLSAMVFISNLCTDIIIPSFRIFLALIISNALSSFIRLGSISEFYIKTVKYIMKVSVSVICFILTIQTTITGGKDSISVKAGKILAGSAIPVIGPALQDAVSSIYSAMESVKGFAGAAGMVTIAGIFIPVLIILSVYYFILSGVFIRADIFDTVSIKLFIKGFIDIIQLMISIIVLYMVMLIFSLSIMVAITNGV